MVTDIQFYGDVILPREPLTTSYVHSASPYSLCGLTMGQVLEEAYMECPDHQIYKICDTGETITYRYIRNKATAYAKGLLALGMKKSDVICLCGVTNSDWICLIYAAQYIGCLIHVSPQGPPYGDTFQIVAAKTLPKMVVFGPDINNEPFISVSDTLQIKDGKVNNSDYVEHVFYQSGMSSTHSAVLESGLKSLDELVELGRMTTEQQFKEACKHVEPDDPVLLFPTSGSTGEPKMVANSHFNLVNFAKFNFGMTLPGKDATKENPSVVCHTNTWCDEYMAFYWQITLIYGKDLNTGVILPNEIQDDKEEILKIIERERATHCLLFPSYYVGMTECPNLKKYDLSSLKYCTLGTQRCSRELFDSLWEITPTISHTYGNSEIALLSVNVPEDTDKDKISSTIGHVRPFYEAKIVDEKGRIQPIGKEGEICAKGWGVMWGYWNDPEKTRNSFKNGWFHTGDAGLMDSTGRLTILGRQAHAIRYKQYESGEMVYPGPVEDLVKQHPKIAQAELIGVPSDYAGDDLCICVILKPGEKMVKEELKAYCEEKLYYLWRPEHYVFLESFPRTGTRNKVAKIKLREIVEGMLKLSKIKTGDKKL